MLPASDLEYTLAGTFMADAPTDEVFLFLPSPRVTMVNGRLAFHVPPEPYFAFDLNGANQLTDDMHIERGLPKFSLELSEQYGLWSDTEYQLLWNFHRAKGYDPDSQNIAAACGYPLIDVESLCPRVTGRCSRILRGHIGLTRVCKETHWSSRIGTLSRIQFYLAILSTQSCLCTCFFIT
jgi:hypothetical protein